MITYFTETNYHVDIQCVANKRVFVNVAADSDAEDLSTEE